MVFKVSEHYRGPMHLKVALQFPGNNSLAFSIQISGVAVVCLTVLTLYFGSLSYPQPVSVKYRDNLSECTPATCTGLFLWEGAKVTIRTWQLFIAALR